MPHSGPFEILVVDDDPATAEVLAQLLRKEKYQVEIAFAIDEAVAILKDPKRKISVILSDLRLGAEEGVSLLPISKLLDPAPPIIFVTGYGSVDSVVDALHDGAFDYISKPNDLMAIEEDLKNAVARAVKHRLTLQITPQTQSSFAHNDSRVMVGTSPAMVKVYRALAKASLTRENVIITGESGTGKELVARAIHEKSAWASLPFVTVNCCALTETLLESELFGHVRGSFTGATQNKKGLFEEANGGTLFLDEIGDISLSLQVKLLRAVQEGEIKPVGSNETRRVDVRLVAATHRDLGKSVQEGKFREDLYYRLKVMLIEMPALRDRTQDISQLTGYFVSRYAKRTGKQITEVSQDALELLMLYPWPGNIRELENAISRAAAMSNTAVLYPEDFPAEVILHDTSTDATELPVPSLGTTLKKSPEDLCGESLETLERRHIARVLENVHFNKSKAAEILGIDRVTLYRKAFKYGILSKGTPRTMENETGS